MRIPFFVMSIFWVSACSPESGPKSIALIIEVADELDGPLEGARIFIQKRDCGETDYRGRVTAQLQGPEGRRFDVGVSCPKGRVAESESQRELNVRFLKRVDSEDAVFAPMEVFFRCVPVTRKIALFVRADSRADLPVKAMGRELTRTDSQGAAQTVIEGIPGDEIEIQIDTSGDPGLRPAMPSRRFTMPKRNQILIFDQKFENKENRAKNTKQRRRTHAGPRRI